MDGWYQGDHYRLLWRQCTNIATRQKSTLPPKRGTERKSGDITPFQGEEAGCWGRWEQAERWHFSRALVERYSLLGTRVFVGVGGDRWLGVAGAVFRGQVGTEGTGTGPRLEQSRRLKQLTSGWAAVLGPVVGLRV